MAKRCKTPAGFFGQHGRTVVGHQCPRQTAFHKGLSQAVHQAFGGFRQIKLQMTAQPRVIVEDGKGHRTMPLARWVQDADFRLVKVQMPQTMNMADFITSHFPALETFGGLSCPGLALAGCTVRIQPLSLMQRSTVL